MKIAIDARIINSSTGRYIERLIHYLEELDQQNDYLILVRRKDLDYYKPTNPHFQIIEAEFADYSFAEQLGFLRLLNRLHPDLVHFCMPQQPVLYRGKHITTVHDLTVLNTYNSDKNYFVYKCKQLVARFVFYRIGHTSTHILCPSQFTKGSYAAFAHIPTGKITVTYEGCDLSQANPEPYASLIGKQFLLYVGQQSDYKNVRRLILAHQELRKTHSELLLVLVGRLTGKDGVMLARNREWVSTQKFTGVIYTDFVPDAQLAWLYQHCATYVFPSLMEGFGLPGLEAMSFGAPVASSSATCLPEIYKEGAHYFNPHSVDDMVVKINEILSNVELRGTLIKAGKLVAGSYSWRRMAEETLKAYRSV
ncbi:MAG TPA: glycosyltransferase family 1 protein [Candidatus Acidoferrum sp.]|nr:glycosyltransferase family 1 protein [Candidatus Acidoferrum sp.]